METDSILEKMRILNGDTNRKILELLLQGPKDFKSLKRESGLSRSTIFDSLKVLMEQDIIKRELLQDQSKGRPAYEYSVKDFYLPELTKTNLLDFLKGMDLDAKSVRLIDLSILDDLIEIFPVPIEFILYMMISSGFKFNHAFQILIDLRPDLKDEAKYNEIINKIIFIAEKRYPIDEIALEIFEERSTKEIFIISEKEEKISTLEDLKNIALSELQIMEIEADYLAQDVWMTLVIMGIYEIEYPSLVNLMYILAKNTKIICKRPPYFHQAINLPDFKELKNIILIESGRKVKQLEEIPWSSIEISRYLKRKMNFDKIKCDLLANIIVEKLYILGLEKYSFSFLDYLVKELIRELRP